MQYLAFGKSLRKSYSEPMDQSITDSAIRGKSRVRRSRFVNIVSVSRPIFWLDC
jgi:hypothetical protein